MNDEVKASIAAIDDHLEHIKYYTQRMTPVPEGDAKPSRLGGIAIGAVFGYVVGYIFSSRKQEIPVKPEAPQRPMDPSLAAQGPVVHPPDSMGPMLAEYGTAHDMKNRMRS